MANDDDDWGNDDFSFDGESVGPEDLNKGGATVDKEGWYHFEVADVKPELDTVGTSGHEKSPAILFMCNVVQAVKDQSPVGSMLYHRIYLASKGGGPPAEGSRNSALRFGLGLGILEYREIGGREVVVDKASGKTAIVASMWKQAKGKQFIAEVKFEKGEGNYKDKYVLNYGEAYHPNDPKVAHVAKNVDALAMAGIVLGQQPPPAAKPAAAPATNGAAKSAPAPVAAATDDDLSDL